MRLSNYIYVAIAIATAFLLGLWIGPECSLQRIELPTIQPDSN